MTERLPASAPHSPTLRVTLVFVGLIVVIMFALLPIARTQGPPMPGFNAAFAAGVFVAELATSFLLLVVLRQTARPSILLLANAYLYSALMALAYMMAYPDAITAGRSLIGGPQTVSWIYNSWIFGFAFLTFSAVLVELASPGPLARHQAQRLAYAGNALVTALVAVLIVVYASQSSQLP